MTIDRRRFLQATGTSGLAVGAGVLGLAGWGAARAVAGGTRPATAAEALQILALGNDRYELGQTIHPNRSQERRQELAEVQNPFAVIVGCADSRTEPAVIFDLGLGDLFVCRTAGNVIDEVVLGSVEYAVAVLGARLIVVLGHSSCGAVEAAIKGNPPGAIGSITRIVDPAVKSTAGQPGNHLANATMQNVKNMRDILAERPSLLTPFKQAGSLLVVGAYYDLFEGEVELV